MKTLWRVLGGAVLLSGCSTVPAPKAALPRPAPLYYAPPTQTCADGSIILTTDRCLLPPAPRAAAPPPLPRPGPARGERG